MKAILISTLLLYGGLINAQNNTGKAKDTTVQFTVFGKCAMCKTRIEEAAKGRGVITTNWDTKTNVFTLQYYPQQTTPDKVEQRIVDVGHDTENKKAKDFIYKDLPDCCLYRDGSKEDSVFDDASSSEMVMGVVMEVDDKGNFKPLEGATILLNGSNSGIVTSKTGYFKLMPGIDKSFITISYVGFAPEKINVQPGQHLNIVLNPGKQLQEVKVIANKRATYISAATPLRTQVMTEKELFKAACCNLSESFETNPAVDVSYSDAVTGSKQIQLLGLSGNYTQLSVENLPGPRGIATLWGLNSIPGTWVEAIQLTKGVGSVVNGFESIAGQINVELKKPEKSEQVYANVYVNDQGKTDLNLNLSRSLGKKWSTALLLHDAFFNNTGVDFNKDGFRDLPTGNLFSMMNRWKFSNLKGLEGQFGVRILIDNKTGGQTDFDPEKHKFTTTFYGLGIKTNRYEAFAKVGYVFPEKKFKSFGIQLSTYRHEQNSYFGLTKYDAEQRNFYTNFIYQSIISNTNHKFRTGLSIVSDNYNELLNAAIYRRKEVVPGVFFEYTYSLKDHFSIVAGIRADNNNLYGFFLTPRLHIRYEPVKGTVLRLAAGRGQRTANIFAENSSVFVSSRNVSILNGSTGKAYGLEPEIAWSEGISLDQRFSLFGKSATLGVDYFRTDFQNQVITDIEQSARQVNFYNLIGKSFSNSFQAELNYELLRKLDLRLAYRLFDVKTTYNNELLQKPLVAKHRGFANLAYEAKGWKFDYTVTFNGKKRIPFTADNPSVHQLEEKSPAYVLMNAQVTKTMGNKFPVDVYLGSENIGNYYQGRVIIASDQPFGQHFDASMIWGPVSGRMFYAGVRVKIK